MFSDNGDNDNGCDTFWRRMASRFGIGWRGEPDDLLAQARRSEREQQRIAAETHARNREFAVQAITQATKLETMVTDMQKRVDDLQAEAEFALKRGDQESALKLLEKKQSYEMSLTSMQETLAQAMETADAVKRAIKREEERIRKETADKLNRLR